jgi:hypothetical protein
MTGPEIRKWAKAILVKIHVITGWVIPEDEGYMNILMDQFEKKLSESYSNVNADEIEYAFRTFGTTVKDWGKSMNLSLIDEVMIPYLEQRATVSKIEEQKQPLQIEMKEDLSDKSMQDWFDETVKQVKQKTVAVEFIPPMVCEWAITKGLLGNPADYYAQAARKIGSDLFNNALDRESIREYTKFKEMFNSGEFSGEWVGKIERLSKQLALMEYAEKK